MADIPGELRQVDNSNELLTGRNGPPTRYYGNLAWLLDAWRAACAADPGLRARADALLRGDDDRTESEEVL